MISLFHSLFIYSSFVFVSFFVSHFFSCLFGLVWLEVFLFVVVDLLLFLKKFYFLFWCYSDWYNETVL